MVMKVYLVRHGETNYNVLNLHNEDPAVDVHLTETGIKQAKKVANTLKNKNLEHIFVSELKRTQQTADIINKYHQVAITVDKRLNDNKTGYEGQPDSIYHEQLKESQDVWNVSFNDGESLNDVWNRIDSFIDYLQGQHYKSCAVVTSRIIVQYFLAIDRGGTIEQADEYYVDKGSCIELDLT
jgi:probable phosphoglycerate mutase